MSALGAIVMSIKPMKSDDIPVTKKHLELVKNELKSETTSLRLETQSGFLKVEARFAGFDARFERIESVLFEMKAILEDQNSRNRIVLDGYAHLFEKSVQTNSRVENLETEVFGISHK